jgi:hypothetical protein
MKVVHYTDGASFGGVEQVTLTLLAKLDRVRWTPLLLHHQDEDETPLSARARALGVPALCVPRLRSSAHTPLHMAGFTRRLRSERPVIFHAHLNWPLACQHGLLCGRQSSSRPHTS